jgi:hypothetical protein
MIAVVHTLVRIDMLVVGLAILRIQLIALEKIRLTKRK